MTQLGASGDARAEAAEAVAHGLAERLQGLEASGPAGGPPLSPDSVRFADGALRCCARWMPRHSPEE